MFLQVAVRPSMRGGEIPPSLQEVFPGDLPSPPRATTLDAALSLAADLAKRVLESGGETYRAEELMVRAGRSLGLDSCEVFVIPTGVIASATRNDESRAIVRRVERRGINLGEICRLEELARNLETGRAAEEAVRQGLAPEFQVRRHGLPLRILFSGWIAAFFALLFGGAPVDFGLALAIGPIVAAVSALLDREEIPPYFSLMGSSALCVFLALGGQALRPDVQLDALITGPLMLLVPGIAITNSVRDTIEGDLVAGLARGIEAFLLAAALAVGAGFALKCGEILSR